MSDYFYQLVDLGDGFRKLAEILLGTNQLDQTRNLVGRSQDCLERAYSLLTAPSIKEFNDKLDRAMGSQEKSS